MPPIVAGGGAFRKGNTKIVTRNFLDPGVLSFGDVKPAKTKATLKILSKTLFRAGFNLSGRNTPSRAPSAMSGTAFGVQPNFELQPRKIKQKRGSVANKKAGGEFMTSPGKVSHQTMRQKQRAELLRHQFSGKIRSVKPSAEMSGILNVQQAEINLLPAYQTIFSRQTFKDEFKNLIFPAALRSQADRSPANVSRQEMDGPFDPLIQEDDDYVSHIQSSIENPKNIGTSEFVKDSNRTPNMESRTSFNQEVNNNGQWEENLDTHHGVPTVEINLDINGVRSSTQQMQHNQLGE